MADERESTLRVTRLLDNPVGAPAPPGKGGDIVRVSDGAVSVYLTPAEFDGIDDTALRYRRAAAPQNRN